MSDFSGAKAKRLDGLKCQVEAIFQIFCRFELDTPLYVITLSTVINNLNKKVSFLIHKTTSEAKCRTLIFLLC